MFSSYEDYMYCSPLTDGKEMYYFFNDDDDDDWEREEEEYKRAVRAKKER